MFAFFLVVVRWTLNDWPVVIIQKCQGGNSKYYNGQILHLAPCYMIYIFIAGGNAPACKWRWWASLGCRGLMIIAIPGP